MISNIRQLYKARELIWAWAFRTVRVRYKQSVLGGLWAVIVPITSVAIFSIIFTYFIPVDTGGTPYLVFSYTAMVPWTFFSASITDMVVSIVGNMNLVGKIYFPREVLPFSAIIARLVDFAIAFSILILLIIVYRVEIYILGWLLIPFIVLTQMALSLGIGLAGSALNVFYRDINHLIALGIQLWFYATPIIYPVSSVPPKYLPLYYLNPMAGVIEAYRSIILYHQLPGPYFLISVAVALISFTIGYIIFKRFEFQFADVV